MTKNANFGQNLVAFGQKIVGFTGESKSFGTHTTENHLRTFLHCFLVGQGIKWAK